MATKAQRHKEKLFDNRSGFRVQRFRVQSLEVRVDAQSEPLIPSLWGNRIEKIELVKPVAGQIEDENENEDDIPAR
jgi:hypothetical protein